MRLSIVKTYSSHVDFCMSVFNSLSMMKLSPGTYRITVETIKQQRTGEQNKFYWAILQELAEETGNGTEDLHDSFRAMFLTDRSTMPWRVKSTTELSIREFITYLDQILAYVGSEMGITVRQTREF